MTSTGRKYNTMIVVVAVVAALVATTSPTQVSAAVAPTVESGNPECSDLGLLGLKVTTDSPVGTYSLPGMPSSSVVVTSKTGPRRFDWTSNVGLDAVIVKGRSESNIYQYDNATSDTDLAAPPIKGDVDSQINFIELCYDGRRAATITADTQQVDGARGVGIRDIPLTDLPGQLLNQVAGADLVNDAGTGLRFSGTSLRFSGTSLRFSGTGLRFSGTGLRFSGTSLRFSGTSLRFSGTGLRFSGTSLRFSGDGIGGLVDIRSAGTSLRFSGTGLRFSDFVPASVPAWDVPLSDLQPPSPYSWDDVFDAIGEFQGFPPQNVTFGQLLDVLAGGFDSTDPTLAPGEPRRLVLDALASMSLLDFDPNGAVLRDVSLVGLLFGSTPLSAIPLPAGASWCSIADPVVEPSAACEVGDSTILALNLAGLRSDNIPLDGIPIDGITFDPDSVMAQLLDPASPIHVPVAEAGESVASYLVRGIDALNVPWEQLPLVGGFDVKKYALGSPVTFTSTWTQAGSTPTDVGVTSPDGFELAAGSPSCVASLGTCDATVETDGTIVRVSPGATTSEPQTITLTMVYRPKGLMDTAQEPSGGSFDFSISSVTKVFPVQVSDPWAGQLDSPPVDPDVLYFANAAGDDIDRYDADVSGYSPGSHVAVRLSNLSNDADLVLYRSAGTSLRFSGTGMRFSGTGLRFSGTGLRFSGDAGDQSVASLESETLEDVPIDQSRIVEDVSANRSITPEAAEGFTSADTTNFEIQVSGFNQATTDYVMRVAVTEFGDACLAAERPTADVAFSGSGSTLVLYPESRFTTTDQGTIQDSLDNLTNNWGEVTVGKVTTSGTDWTTETGACSVFAANSVAEDVAAQVQARAQTQTIEHVMIIGGDDKLPFYRTADTTLIANEANYASTVGGQNALTSALATQHVLTDDIYGDDDPWPFLNRLYFTPDRAVGRLVESAADIAGQIDRFVTSKGVIAVDRAFTAGYDFLSDAAVEIDANLGDEVSTTKTSLISDIGTIPDWSIAQLNGALAGTGPVPGEDLKVASINGHMDQGLLLSALGDAQGDTPSPSEVAKPDVVIPSGVNGAVMFTAGCHAGFSQPYEDALRKDDWAQAVAGGPAAVYLANTGYGYGLDQPVVGYSEELLVSFSDLLEIDGMTVGQAAMFAKQQYFTSQLEIDPYDEKSQMQLTTYGVPMYSLTAPVAATAAPAALAAAASASVVTEPPVFDPNTELQVASIDASNTFSSRTGAKNTSYFRLDASTVNGVPAAVGLEAGNGNPIQPKLSSDVTVPGQIARGAIIESLTSVRENLDNPTIARATIDNTSIENPGAAGEVIFPTAFVNVQTEQTPDGPRGKLVVVPGQYDSTQDEEQLLISSLELTTYYAPDSNSNNGVTEDIVRPQFGDVSASAIGSDVLFRASVTDPQGTNVFWTGVKRVLVQYFDGAAWNAVEMFPANPERTEWSGGLADAVATNGVFFVQAVDGGGNVAVTANKGSNYDTGGLPAQAVAFVTGDQGDNGWYVGPATLELKGSAVIPASEGVEGSHLVKINNDEPFQYAGPVALTTEGINDVTITGPGAAPITKTVNIDTVAPLVELETPIALLTPDDTVAPAMLAACSDPEPGSRLRDLDPEGDGFCEVTQKDYSIVVGGETYEPFTLNSARGQDVAGNETITNQSAVIISGTLGTNGYYTTAVILGIIGEESDTATYSLTGLGGPFLDYLEPFDIPNGSDVIVKVGEETLPLGTIKVDTEFPDATASPVPSGTYDLNQVVPITCTFGDETGLTSVACGSTTGTTQTSLSAKLDTSTPGEKEFIVYAKDVAGNETTTTYRYSVSDSYACDPDTDGVTANGDIWKCATKVDATNRRATLSIVVRDGGTIDATTQYRLRVASSPSQTGTLVKYAGGSITGKPLVSATPTGSRLDFVIDLKSVGVAPGGTLYWAAETQSGEKGKPSAGFLDVAPNTTPTPWPGSVNGYFTLTT